MNSPTEKGKIEVSLPRVLTHSGKMRRVYQSANPFSKIAAALSTTVNKKITEKTLFFIFNIQLPGWS
jgi:hypothetical protein